MEFEAILVRAPEGLKCPKEHAPREYIEHIPVVVRNTSYYRARVKDGSLEFLGFDGAKKEENPAGPDGQSGQKNKSRKGVVR